MKIVVAPDSFKGSLSAREAAFYIGEGIKKIIPDAETALIPVADGGEGTLECLTEESARRRVRVTGPMGGPVEAEYAAADGMGIVEMARAAGLLLAPDSRAALATTYGVGELIKECLVRGCRRILLTVGGSATNDGGCGMLCALGARFLRKDGSSFVPAGGTLGEIETIDTSELSGAFLACEFTVAADVRNPLLGESGATMTYARQKGASDEELRLMEQGMAHYAAILERMTGKKVSQLPSSGAAGGVAVPIMAFGKCTVRSGARAVLSASGFYDAAADADLVICGEGRIDSQSLWGKAAGEIAGFCRERRIPLYCICGASACAERPEGIAKILTAESLADSPADSMARAPRYLTVLGSLAAIDLAGGAVRRGY
ncbi:MAG: glycerate kinase [Abditibacteriota bacterium]|nr:glycerate kinase [Abditibacteriota bacterium]